MAFNVTSQFVEHCFIADDVYRFRRQYYMQWYQVCIVVVNEPLLLTVCLMSVIPLSASIMFLAASPAAHSRCIFSTLCSQSSALNTNLLPAELNLCRSLFCC